MKIYNRYTRRLIGEFDIFPGANLSGVTLFDADLSGANLRGANLSGADFSFSSLSDANLRGANLRGATLSNTYLRGADLTGANLSGAYLSDADLQDANLENAKLPKFQIPQRKSLIVFKKLQNDKIAKLRIPCRAKRTASLVGNKCRAERAIVLDIYHAGDSSVKFQTGRSMHDPSFIYEVGKEVKPTEEYSGDILEPCLPGIHFFMTEEEARRYV